MCVAQGLTSGLTGLELLDLKGNTKLTCPLAVQQTGEVFVF